MTISFLKGEKALISIFQRSPLLGEGIMVQERSREFTYEAASVFLNLF